MKKFIPYILGYCLISYFFNYFTYSKSFPDDVVGLLIQSFIFFLVVAIIPSLIYIFSKSLKAFKISYWVIFAIILILTKGAHYMATNPPSTL